jgi:hypothetical protein
MVHFGEGSFIQSRRGSFLKANYRPSLSRKHRPSVLRKDSIFFILDEDKIFDDERFKTSVEWVKSLQANKKPLKLNNTEINFIDVYNTNNPNFIRIKKAKKMKNLDLDRYQRNLIENIGDCMSKESIRKLETKLNNVKNMANKVKKEETIEYLYTQISEENEVTIGKLKDSIDKLNHIRNIVKIGSERLPLIKHKL